MKVKNYLLIGCCVVLLSVTLSAQVSIFPKIGFAQIDLKNWDKTNRTILEKYKYPVLFVGFGLEEKITKKFKFVCSTQYSSKIEFYAIGNYSWSKGSKEHFSRSNNLWVNDLTFYYKIFNEISFGFGLNHLQSRNFQYPGLLAVNLDKEEMRNEKLNYFGYHFGLNYEWKSIGVFLKYSFTTHSKWDTKQRPLIIIAEKIPFLSLSFYHKFKILT
jgi:hypothetical protein